MRDERRRRARRCQLAASEPIPSLKNPAHAKTLRRPKKSRPKKWAHLYGSKWWKRVRLHILNRNPLCRHCKDAPATDLDHIEAHRGDPALFFDYDNLMPLCQKCHRHKTAWERQKSLKREYRKG